MCAWLGFERGSNFANRPPFPSGSPSLCLHASRHPHKKRKEEREREGGRDVIIIRFGTNISMNLLDFRPDLDVLSSTRDTRIEWRPASMEERRFLPSSFPSPSFLPLSFPSSVTRMITRVVARCGYR